MTLSREYPNFYGQPIDPFMRERHYPLGLDDIERPCTGCSYWAPLNEHDLCDVCAEQETVL